MTERPQPDARIADAVRSLESLGDRPPEEHVEVYEDVHRVLQEALTDAAVQEPDEPEEPRP